MTVRIGSLFSGAGGLDLAVEHVTGGRMRHAFCDRCGRYCVVRNHRDCVCHDCELGVNSIAAMLNPRWARPMTSSEIQLAHTWLMIDSGAA